MAYDEFLAAPEFYGRHVEWVDGEVLELTAPSIVHQRIVQFLWKLIDLFLEERAVGGEAFVAPLQTKLGEGLPGREPDLAYIGPAKLDRLRLNHLEGPPDLVCEVISPESARRDRLVKFDEYARAGVREYWLIDPETKSVEFYALNADGKYAPIAAGGDGVARSAVLGGFWLATEWIWRNPPPTRAEVLEAWKDSNA